MSKPQGTDTSNEDETYNDYFTNPIKRKQYDNMRLYQQQRELQRMSGFNQQVEIEIPKKLKEEPESKNYATVSLFCLTVTNPFRDKMIRLVLNQWFDRFILLTILVNCVFLAMDDPNAPPYPYQVVADMVFQVIFTIEMVFKIIALGFVFKPHSYLRDVWNVLDFCVVIMGWVSQVITSSNVSAIRVIRILRPLRTINSIPSMRKLVHALLNSLPTMLDVFILFSFFLLIFGTMATQLFGGTMQNRCVDKFKNKLKTKWDDDIFCSRDLPCVEGNCVYWGNPDYGVTSFDNILKSVLNVFIVITLEGWTATMYKVRHSTGTLAYDAFFLIAVILGSFFILSLMVAVQSSYVSQSFQEPQIDDKKDEQIQKQFEAEAQHPENIINAAASENRSIIDPTSNNIENSSNIQIQLSQVQPPPSSQPEFANDQQTNNGPIIQQKESLGSEKKTFCLKFKEFQLRIRQIIESNLFNQIILIIILINTLVMAIDHYEMSDHLINILYYINMVLTIIFVAEMVIKIIGLGIRDYLRDGFNIFDSIIIIIGLLEYFGIGNKVATVLRSFRLLRIFKIVRSWSGLRKLLKTVLASLQSIANLALLMLLLLFIYSLVGMQFFSGEQIQSPDPDDDPVRFNFNSFSYSVVTMFIVITAENWNGLLAPYIYKDGWGASFYFVTMIIFGNLMLLNLFLAILLNFISENLEEDDDINKEGDQGNQNNNGSGDDIIEEELDYIQEKLRVLAKIKKTSLKSGEQHSIKEGGGAPPSAATEDNNAIQQQDNINDMLETKNIILNLNDQLDEKKEEEEVQTCFQKSKKSSLYLFKPDNCFRRIFINIHQHSYFEDFIYHLIALNSLLLIINSPAIEEPYFDNTINIMTTIISIFFVGEALIKIISMGFIVGENTYLKDSWNILDFVIVASSILNWFFDYFFQKSFTFLRGFRALRALRPLRMISKDEGMKTIVNSLLKAIPSLFNVALINLLFFVVFGILGVQIFKGQMGHCNDEKMDLKINCKGKFILQGEKIDREWIVPFNNFDNVMWSMITFFELATLEGWPNTLLRIVDSQGVDMGPKKDNRLQASILFIVFIFIQTFFVMNLFVSVIVDKFNEEIKRRQGANNFTEEQKEWVKMQRIMLHVNLKIRPTMPVNNKFRKFIFKAVLTDYFENFIMFIIALNTLFLCLDYVGSPQPLQKVIDIGNIIFISIFAFEALMKLIGLGIRYYFLETWNRFDFLIVILSILAMNEDLFSFKVTAFRIIRVARLLRVVKSSKGLKNLLKALWLSLKNIVNVALILFLIFFTFSVAGMDLFGQIDNGDFINGDANFSTFYLSIITLFRCATGEDWNGVMHDTFESVGTGAIIYWISFQLITKYIFLNVFIAVIYENFNDVNASENESDVLSLRRKDIKAFINTWAIFCPNGENYMKTAKFPAFLQELPPPLGYGGINIDNSKLNKIIYCLNIKSHKLEKDSEAVVYFPEVMWSIFHSIIGNNEEKVQKCEQVQYIMRELRNKYKGLGKTLSVDRLCGNKYYKNEMTVSKYLVALQIYRSWRQFQANNEKQKNQKIKNILEPKSLQFEPQVIQETIVKSYFIQSPPRQHNNISQQVQAAQNNNRRVRDNEHMISQQFRDVESEEIQSRRESSHSNIRINLRINNETIRNRAITASNNGRDNNVSRTDAEERTRSLSNSYFETEREEDLYENQRD